MNFGIDYVGALTSRIGGAGSVWSGYGTGSVRKSGRQQLTKGQAVAQASYADTFMKMSRAERREAVESGTRINTGTSSSGRYGNAGNIRSTGNSNLYNKLYGSSARANSSVLEGGVKAEAAGKTLGSNGLYGTNSLYGLMSSYGLGSSYGLTGNYGLSSFLGNWLA